MTVYKVKRTDSSHESINIQEEEINTDTDITLFGRRRLAYGQDMNANLLHLLENFACPQLADTDPALPDTTQASTRGGTDTTKLLEDPIVGQLWFNSTASMFYTWDGLQWSPYLLGGSIAANWGVIAHGDTIPLPVSPSGVVFTRAECSWVVSPYSYPLNIDYMNCRTNDSGVVTMQYSLAGDPDVLDGYANYMIVAIKDNDSTGILEPAVSLTPTPTATSSSTPTPTPTPSTSVSPSVTPTPTPTVSDTPTPTPTISVTPSITPTVTPTVSTGALISMPAEGTEISSLEHAAAPATADFALQSDGDYEYFEYATLPPKWLVSGSAGDYEVRVIETSGTFDSGDLTNTWLNLGTTRSWHNTSTLPQTVAFTMEIRDAGTLDSFGVVNMTMYTEGNIGA